MTDPSFLAPLFRRWGKRTFLSEADIQALQSLPWTVRAFERDSYLIREGDSPPDCRLLLQGFACRHKIVRDGARQIVSIHIPSEFVDLQNCLLPESDHSVQALTRGEMGSVPKAALMEVAEANPKIGRAMWWDTLIDSSVFREWVVNVGRRDARSRIAHLICELAARMEACGLGDNGSYDFPLTQEKLADATGLTPVHTNRVLQSLRKDELISLSFQSLKVLDWERLRQVGEFSDRYLHQAA